MTPARIATAHAALPLAESPFLKHYSGGKFGRFRGVACSTSSLPGPGFNFAAAFADAPPLTEIIPFAREFFGPAEWGVLVEGDAGHPIEAELRAAGWKVAEDEPAYVIEHLPPPVALDAADFRPLATEADRLTFMHIAAAAFETTTEFAEMMMPHLGFATDPAMHWAILDVAGEPAAVGGYYRAGPTAVVCCLATLPAARGRGVGGRVLGYLLNHAAAAGFTAAALRSGPASVPLYERHGFRYACQHRTYAAPPDAAA